MERREHMDFTGAATLVVFGALLGLNQALVKLVNAGLAPVFQSGLRSACAVVVVSLWMLHRRKALVFPPGTIGFGLLNGVLFSGEFALLFLALDYSTVARVSLLFYTMPLFVAVGSHFLFPGDRLTPTRILGLFVAFGGVALVLSGNSDGTARATLAGDVMALAATLCWAALTLLTRATRLAELSPEQNLLYPLFVSAILLLAIAPLFGDTLREPTLAIWGIFAFQVVVITSLGFIVWLWVLSVYPVSRMASFSLLTPLFGVFFGWLIFDEHLSATFLVALLAVCGGLVLVNRRGS